MTATVFFRLLKTPIDDKGARLAAQIAALNVTGEAGETYTLDPADFAIIPGSPFAYWVGESLRHKFVNSPTLKTYKFSVQHGLSTKNDFRWLRLDWEVPVTAKNLRWYSFAKGGAFARYYLDLHLLVDAQDDFAELEAELLEKYPYLGDNAGWVLHPENDYLSPGLTYTRRTTSPFSVRAYPAGAYFSDKGPVCIGEGSTLLPTLALVNSCLFRYFLELQMGAADAAARSYEVGIVSQIPLPELEQESSASLGLKATEAHDLVRMDATYDETTHAFCLPGLVQHREAKTLFQASLTLEAAAQAAQTRLAAIQAEIDDIVFDLYGLGEPDRALVRAEMGEPQISNRQSQIVNQKSQIENFLMWCVGVAFGRWDARMALDPTLLPPLQGPFDPLPRCAPGALVGPDGLPPAQAADIAPQAWLRARETVLDIPPLASDPSPCPPVSLSPLPKDGILVDDPTHASDIVTHVRQVLALLWGDRAGNIEREACEILGVKALRDYFRDPRKGFFAFHIKRYSKSRRKAPIYWLLQSEKRNYAVWLYIHRLRPDTLFAAGRDYADAKVALEQTRLEELRVGLDSLSPTDGGDERGGLSGSARRRREREIERQQKLVAEVTEFRNRLDQVALLNLPPDLNDGVTISIAPLWELAPWKEAQRTWEKLVAGEYAWSTMAGQMREKGLVKRDA